MCVMQARRLGGGGGGGGGGGVGGFGRTPPPVQASSACPSWFRLPKLVPPAQLGSASVYVER